MRQLTLATAGFERYGKTTRRAAFLNETERVPWRALCALIEPVYPKPCKGQYGTPSPMWRCGDISHAWSGAR